MASAPARSLKAIISGATGATGQCLVPELLKSSAFSQVTVLGRRRYEIDAVFDVNQEEAESSGRLKQAVVNFDELTAENGAEHFKDADVYFCCLGTTKAKAGSAENFRKIDFHLVVKLAEIAKSCDVRHISLVSSTMASSSSYFLYLRTKGEADDAVAKMEFRRTTIWRPGGLVRYGGGAVTRTFSRIFMGLPTEQLARAMRLEALATAHVDGASADDEQPAQYIVNAGIYSILRAEDARLNQEAASAATAVAAAATAAAAAAPADESNGDSSQATETPAPTEAPSAAASEPAAANADAPENAEPAAESSEPAAKPESEPAVEESGSAAESSEPAEPAAEPADSGEVPAAEASETPAEAPQENAEELAAQE